ncbi:MAG: glycosyltransferase family 1 protein [Deltaproteobacteria bacterium]|nr:glycosyltransferase family 1 protein [Deltaproteobacteria bacterium]
MRITILATGSRGDVQPYVALGVGLARAGHGVRVVTTRDFTDLVTSYGLQVATVDIDVQALLAARRSSTAIERGGVLTSFRELANLARRGTRLFLEVGLEAVRDADALVTGFGGLLVAATLAERLGLPLFQAYNVPITPTAEMDGVLFPGVSALPGSWSRRLAHRLSRQVLWQTARMAGNAARKEVLGLGPLPAAWPFDDEPWRRTPLLYGISPSVIARPADWPARARVTGYWLADEPTAWTPPAELSSFLERGEPPIYVGFGSMITEDPAATTQLVLDAVAHSGRRAIVHTGWAGLAADRVPAGVLVVGAVPHSWLLPKVALAVHHGGAGTTAAAIRAGIPSVVVPFHGDQPFWGARVRQLGVGAAPIPRRRLTAARLAGAIAEVLADDAMAARARALGARVRAEDGVAAAVALITGTNVTADPLAG